MWVEEGEKPRKSHYNEWRQGDANGQQHHREHLIDFLPNLECFR